MVKIDLHPEADSEFAAQIEYYEALEPGLGHRFYREVLANLDWIVKNPEVTRLRKDYRRVNLRIFPFYLAYVVETDLVWVLAVAHGRKKPGYWRDRMTDG